MNFFSKGGLRQSVKIVLAGRAIPIQEYTIWKALGSSDSNLGAQKLLPFYRTTLLRSHTFPLKPLYTFGKQYCPRPTLRVPQLIYKITNLWKFRLNQSSESWENNGKTHPCFRTFRRVMTCVQNKSVNLDIENWYCFMFSQKVSISWNNVSSRSPLPSVNPVGYLQNFFVLFSVPKVSIGFKPIRHTILKWNYCQKK